MVTVLRPSYDWREDLVRSVAIPFLSGMVNDYRQKEANKKLNSILSKSYNDALANNNDTSLLPFGFDTSQNLPEGYNSDGWTNAFHQNNSPVEQFNLGTNGLINQQTQKPVTIADMQKAILANLGTNRYGMLDSKTVQEQALPYLQALEAQRVQDMKSRYANDMQNAESWDDQMNLLTRAAIEGAADNDTLRTYGAYAQYRQPYNQPLSIKAGDREYNGSFNPANGNINLQYETEYGIDPAAKYTLDTNAQLRNRELDLTAQRYANDYDIANRQQLELEAQGRYNRENPQLVFQQDAEGNLVGINPRTGAVHVIQTPDGKAISIYNPNDLETFVGQDGQIRVWNKRTNNVWTPTDSNGQGMYPTPRITKSNNSATGTRDITESQKLRNSNLENEKKNLRTQRDDADRKLNLYDVDSSEYKREQAKVQRIDKRLHEIQAEQDEILGVTRNQNRTQKQTQTQPVDTSPVMYTSKDGSHKMTTAEYWNLRYQAENGQLTKQYGIHNADELDTFIAQNYNTATQTPTTNSTSSNDLQILPPLSSDIQNHTTSEDIQAQIDTLNGDNVTSTDVRNPLSDDANIQTTASQDRTMATPAPRREGETFDLDVPDAMFYDQQRDKDTPQNKILTMGEFQTLMSRMLADTRYANYTPDQIIQQLINEGYKIKLGNTQASLDPVANGYRILYEDGDILPPVGQSNIDSNSGSNSEVLPPIPEQYRGDYIYDNSNAPELTGTTFNDIDLPGLDQQPYELAASRKPVKLRPRNRKQRRPAPRTAKRTPAPRAKVSQSQVRGYETHKTAVDNAAKTHGVDKDLIRAIIQVESGWNPNARSSAGAQGLMQLMPATAKGLGVTNAYDASQNINGGTKYIAQLIRRYKGDVTKALWAYNCGPGNVNKNRVPKTSKAYAKNVLSIYNALKGK